MVLDKYVEFNLNGKTHKMCYPVKYVFEAERHLSDGNLMVLVSKAANGVPPTVNDMFTLIKYAIMGGDPKLTEDEAEELYLHSSSLIDRADYVFDVSGDSMEPNYHNGDMVLVRKLSSISDLNYGDVGAFTMENELYIKVFDEKGLRSYNPVYCLMPYTEYERIFLIGEVIGVLQEDDFATREEIQLYEAMSAEHAD